MVELDTIKKVVKKIGSVDEIRDHICFFGGAIPYIYYGEESGREHSDIDILVDKNYINVIRELLKQSGIYQEELDSLQLELDGDYGVKAWIDGVFVEFEPISIEDNVLKRYSFSVEKQMFGIEEIPYDNIDDLIIPFEVDGKISYCQSNELNKTEKEKYRREKDLKDAEFIGRHDIDIEKYERVKKAIEESKTTIISFDEAKKKQELASMLNQNLEQKEDSNLKIDDDYIWGKVGRSR